MNGPRTKIDPVIRAIMIAVMLIAAAGLAATAFLSRRTPEPAPTIRPESGRETRNGSDAPWGRESEGSSNGADSAPKGDCSASFLGGRRPAMTGTAARGTELCYAAFAVLHSPSTRTPLWSAEGLDPARLAAARGIERASTFHEETALPAEERADLDDYRRSGYDRGHLAPSADMPDDDAQQESFSLANMVPQDPSLNRGPWADLEADVRSLARRRDAIYVVTGAIFEPGARKLRSRVSVPTYVWKAVASPGEGASVLSTRNGPPSGFVVETVESFTRRTGIDPFPALGRDERSNLLDTLGGRR
jgi:endonuclease G